MDVLSSLAGAMTGVLSSWGIGGGSLLLIYMTAVTGASQHQAQGINLLYFIPTSASALYMHVKNRLVDFRAAVPAIITGVPMTLLTSIIAAGIDTVLLRKAFGVFLILMGVSEFFRKSGKTVDGVTSEV